MGPLALALAALAAAAPQGAPAAALAAPGTSPTTPAAILGPGGALTALAAQVAAQLGAPEAGRRGLALAIDAEPAALRSALAAALTAALARQGWSASGLAAQPSEAPEALAAKARDAGADWVVRLTVGLDPPAETVSALGDATPLWSSFFLQGHPGVPAAPPRSFSATVPLDEPLRLVVGPFPERLSHLAVRRLATLPYPVLALACGDAGAGGPTLVAVARDAVHALDAAGVEVASRPLPTPEHPVRAPLATAVIGPLGGGRIGVAQAGADEGEVLALRGHRLVRVAALPMAPLAAGPWGTLFGAFAPGRGALRDLLSTGVDPGARPRRAGDLVAVAAFRPFSAQEVDFGALHPGGRLELIGPKLEPARWIADVGEGFALADLDGDHRPELVASSRGEPGALRVLRVSLAEPDPAGAPPAFRAGPLPGVFVAGCAAELTGDGLDDALLAAAERAPDGAATTALWLITADPAVASSGAAAPAIAALATAGGDSARPVGLRPAYGGELRVALPAMPRTGDPALATSPADLFLARALHATPLELGPDGALRPGLLSELPRPSADGRSWHLTLREGLRFADGSPLGAAELAASLARLVRPEVASPHAWLVASVAGAVDPPAGRGGALAGARVLSPRELVLTLDFPFPELPWALAALPAAVVSPTGAGAGAFRAERPGALDRLVASELDPRGRPFLDALRLSAPDGRAVARALPAGELDLALRPEPLPGAVPGARPEVVLAAVNDRALGAGAAAVRRALLALDRTELVRRFVRAPAEPLAALLPPAVLAEGIPAAVPAGASPAPARGGAPDRLVLLVPGWSPDLKAVAERLQVKLFDAGLRVVLEPADPARHAERLQAGDYDVALLSVMLLSASPPLAAGQLAGAVAGPRAAARAERALAGLTGEAAAAAAEALRAALDLVPLYVAGLRTAARPGLHPAAAGSPALALDPGDLWLEPAP